MRQDKLIYLRVPCDGYDKMKSGNKDSDYSRIFQEPDVLQWSRVGVFKYIYKQCALVPAIVRGEVKKKSQGTSYAFEEFRYLSETATYLQPMKVDWGVTYKKNAGGRTYRNGFNVHASILSVNSHLLERLHQRGGFRVVKPSNLWRDIDGEWLRVLQRNAHEFREEDRNLWVVPYQWGSFIVKPIVGTDYGFVCKIFPNKKKGKRCDHVSGRGYGITARTFVNDEQMFQAQREVKDLVLQGRYDDAIDLIKNAEKRVAH